MKLSKRCCSSTVKNLCDSSQYMNTVTSTHTGLGKANVHIFPIIKERSFSNNTYLQFYNVGGDCFFVIYSLAVMTNSTVITLKHLQTFN